MKKNKLARIAITIGAGIAATVSMVASYALGNMNGYENGTRYGAETIRDVGREMYDDYDEKILEYLDRSEENDD